MSDATDQLIQASIASLSDDYFLISEDLFLVSHNLNRVIEQNKEALAYAVKVTKPSKLRTLTLVGLGVVAGYKLCTLKTTLETQLQKDAANTDGLSYLITDI
jgi:hypothetical protein